MPANRRQLRSATKASAATTPAQPLFQPPPPSTVQSNIHILPPKSKLSGLFHDEETLLRAKQKRLANNATTTLETCPNAHTRAALEATLIFAQYEAGTAVCIHPDGWVLTCAHCFGENEGEYEAGKKMKWMLFYTGLAVQVECRVWDLRRDLALLKIVAMQLDSAIESTSPPFPSVQISLVEVELGDPMVCIGQPGRDDLESTSARRTKYNLVEVSQGTFRGMVEGADPQDNSEIGSLKHNCWTYWGHSGAPLVRETDGRLVGLHSSWDDATAMRHGVPLAAIKAFLHCQTHVLIDSDLDKG